MRIAIVASPFYPIPPVRYGGAERVIYNLIKGLKELDHKPILLASGDSLVDCELIPIVEHSIGLPEVISPAYLKAQRAVELTTARELKKLLPRIDIIHSHGFDMTALNRFPNITTLHTKITFNDFKYYEKRKKHSYVTVSKNQQKSYPALNYVGAIYNGQDIAEFPIVTKPDEYLCFLGRMDPDKNPHLAVQLAINLGMKIKIAGKIDFDGVEYFKKEIKPYLGHPLVEYLGEINSARRIELLSKAKCNLHPVNFHEPFGLTVIEAAYSGTPTLAIKRGSMSELIEDGKTGVLVEDFIEGFHKIDKCFAMDRKYIAQRSRKLFGYQKMTTDYIGVYKKVLKQAGR